MVIGVPSGVVVTGGEIGRRRRELAHRNGTRNRPPRGHNGSGPPGTIIGIDASLALGVLDEASTSWTLEWIRSKSGTVEKDASKSGGADGEALDGLVLGLQR